MITAGILNAGNPNGFTSFRGGGGTLVMDFGSYMTSAQTIGNTGSLGGIPTLVNTLGNLLTGGNLQAATATTITNYVANNTNFPFSTPPTNSQMRDRVRAIVQLIITSAEYSIQK